MHPPIFVVIFSNFLCIEELAQTQIAGGGAAKPSKPFKFLHIWQARNICLQQHKKKQPVCESCFLWDLSLSNCKRSNLRSNYPKIVSKFQLPLARIFHHERKTGSANQACLTKQSNSNWSIIWASSKFKLPRAYMLNDHLTICNLIIQE